MNPCLRDPDPHSGGHCPASTILAGVPLECDPTNAVKIEAFMHNLEIARGELEAYHLTAWTNLVGKTLLEAKEIYDGS